MKAVFVDTLYWLATVIPRDQWKEPAEKATASLGKARLVTTDEVLVEFMNSMRKGGETLRLKAVEMVTAILDDPNTTVIPQSRASFLKGIDFYKERTDKEYSLTDCISMCAMKNEGLKEVLTNDPHFAQEDFAVLITRK